MSQFLRAEQIVTALGGWMDRPGPRYLQLAGALEDLLGRESPGDGARLPSERELAQRLGLSRGTVVAAYEQLAERGLVTRRQGSGTRVVGADRHPAPGLPPLSAAHAADHGDDEQIDLTFGAPYLDELVADLGADALATVARRRPGARLRAARPARRCARPSPSAPARPPDHVLVTNGGQGALALLTAALVRPGDRVIVEAPTYPGAIELFSVRARRSSRSAATTPAPARTSCAAR